MLRASLQQPLYRIEAVDQTLGVVEAVDADNKLPSGETVAQPRCLAGARGPHCARSDSPRIDADRKRRRADAGPVGSDRPVVVCLPAGLSLDIVVECLQIIPGLKADEVIGEQRAYKSLVHRERRQHLGCWEGDVQEKAKRVVDTQPTQG